MMMMVMNDDNSERRISPATFKERGREREITERVSDIFCAHYIRTILYYFSSNNALKSYINRQFIDLNKFYKENILWDEKNKINVVLLRSGKEFIITLKHSWRPHDLRVQADMSSFLPGVYIILYQYKSEYGITGILIIFKYNLNMFLIGLFIRLNLVLICWCLPYLLLDMIFKTGFNLLHYLDSQNGWKKINFKLFEDPQTLICFDELRWACFKVGGGEEQQNRIEKIGKWDENQGGEWKGNSCNFNVNRRSKKEQRRYSPRSTIV